MWNNDPPGTIYNEGYFNRFVPFSGNSMQNNGPANLLFRVNGLDGVKAVRLQRNSVVPLFDENEDFFYIKATDNEGFPTYRKFKYEEVEFTEPKAEQYVTKEELKSILQDTLNDFAKQKEVSNGK